MNDSIGEVLEMVSHEIVGGGKEVINKNFQNGCHHSCRLETEEGVLLLQHFGSEVMGG